jgi:hypothetical protein
MKMADPQQQPQTPLSSQKGLQELEEQDLRKVTGGTDPDPKKEPLLSAAEKAVAAAESVAHPNNGTYHPPRWGSDSEGVFVLPPIPHK